MSCWGLTSGNAGMMAQVRALASVLGETPSMKTIVLKKSCAWIPNSLVAPLSNYIIPYALDKSSDALEAPYPDLVISCGRRAAMAAMGLKAKVIKNGAGSTTPQKTKFIHIQDPHVSPKYFDVVVAMAHDAISGPNVIKMQYALHTITHESLERAHAQFAPRFEIFPQPYVAVLLGGTTNKYSFSKESMAQVIMALQQVLQNTKGSLLITPSRRTGDDNIAMLRASFAASPRVYVYDFVEENPYMGLLALADAIIVTDDSVNMMSEAHATGKPLYILTLPGHEDTKPVRFAQKLIEEKAARPQGRNIESWNYHLPQEMQSIAQQIKNILG